jgi:hypothetical protein
MGIPVVSGLSLLAWNLAKTARRSTQAESRVPIAAQER